MTDCSVALYCLTALSLLIVHAGNDHWNQHCCQLYTSSTSSPSLSFLFFPTYLSPCPGRPGFSSRVELGLGRLPAPLRATNQAESGTQKIHINCWPPTRDRLLLWGPATCHYSQAWHHSLSLVDLLDNHIVLWTLGSLSWALVGVVNVEFTHLDFVLQAVSWLWFAGKCWLLSRCARAVHTEYICVTDMPAGKPEEGTDLDSLSVKPELQLSLGSCRDRGRRGETGAEGGKQVYLKKA